jgi:RNA polymerase sigma-70 factor (ECF subfamily)
MSAKSGDHVPLAYTTNAMTNSDEQLISLWKTLADEAALSQLATRYLPQFYRTARAMMMSHIQSEDIAQEVMLKVIRGLQTFEGDSGFRVWSYAILLNTIRTESYRANRINHTSIDAKCDAMMPADTKHTAPTDHSIRSELQSAFEDALNKLTEAQRTALVLTHIDGLSANEVAVLQECSVDAVYQRTAEAKRRLRADSKLRSLWTEPT